jgi:acetoin utilization deacetylase AcuC-like enzyme
MDRISRISDQMNSTQPAIGCSIISSPGHLLSGHPESPQRFAHFDRLTQDPLGKRIRIFPEQVCALDPILQVHAPEYLKSLEQLCLSGGGFLDYGDTFATPATFQAALTAAGSTLSLLEWVLEAESRAGFALVRPPGHHATRNRAMGFCLLNNIAIAARQARNLGVQRVMIVDFDVHHGNGTQEIFNQDPSVLYVSTHQAGIYPGSGAWSDIGTGPGEGYSVNVPLPAGSGDEVFNQVFDEIIIPVATSFKPELLLVSAGYDAHWNDPLARLHLTTAGYYAIAGALHQIATEHTGGRSLFVLEGGYDPAGLAVNIEATLRALANLPAPDLPQPLLDGPSPDISDLIMALRQLHHLS